MYTPSSGLPYQLIVTEIVTEFRQVPWPTQHAIQRVPGIKRPGREADNLSPSNAEVNNVWSYTSTAPIRVHGEELS
jgi:hypothetical protein